MTDHKKPGVAFWVTVAVVVGLVVLGYPLSVGPANWLMRHGMFPEWTHSTLGTLYQPLNLACDNSEIFANVMRWYVSLWVHF
jgi:hypothetical protein